MSKRRHPSHVTPFLSILLLFTILPFPSVLSSVGVSYRNCDDDAIRGSVPASNLTPNQFVKICPGTKSSVPLSQPRCGDGSFFSFFYTRPSQRHDNKDKILIEFMGGGACWDKYTCEKQADYLAFPTQLDSFVGYGCGEIDVATAGGDGDGGMLFNMLCAETIGDVDFTTYNTVIVPYCTQDVHMGDASNEYTSDDDDEEESGSSEDDEGSGEVFHRGAHNMYQTLRWVFDNFPDLKTIALTGCSAGGTALPVAYDLLNKHYNSPLKAVRSVQINVISDSPVFLTPAYFLEYGLDNWNPSTVMNRINFDYDKHGGTEEYPIKLWDHVLSRGSNNDRWGVVTHTEDPISLMYFQAMSGNYDNNDDDNGDYDKWWGNLTNAFDTIMQKHRNVDTYMIDDEGHCSFGLYYGLQVSGFSDWAGSVFHENRTFGRTPKSMMFFLLWSLAGFGLALGITTVGKNNIKSVHLDHTLLSPYLTKAHGCKSIFPPLPVSFLYKFKSYPITAGYFITTTLYFISMILVSGFAHPLNNPSLGPSARALSSFGINNPTLIVYSLQTWRLTTSIFLCSGLCTYGIVLVCLWNYVRHLEDKIHDSKLFSLVCFSIWMGSNLVYATVAQGASCGAIALVLGLNSFSIAMGKAHTPDGYLLFLRPRCPTVGLFLLTCLLFPFNSWIMSGSAMIIGYFVTPLLFSWSSYENTPIIWMQKERAVGLVVVYALLFLSLMLRLWGGQTTDLAYQNPYLTGCNLMYSTQVGDVMDSFANDANGEGRRLDNDDGLDYDSMCAQLCVPHILYYPLNWGLKESSTGLVLNDGQCEENGYETYIVEKTFSYHTLSMDIELYSYVTYDDAYND